MPFQRSYTKVWWGSDNQLPLDAGLGSGGGASTQIGRFQQSYFGKLQQEEPPQSSSFGSSQQQMHSGYHSLDFNHFKSFGGNLSRIQEVDDEHNLSRLSAASSSLWGDKHDSPGSLRSQDSGFSDNDESHSTRSLGGRSSKTASPSSNKSVRGALSGNDTSSPGSAAGDGDTTSIATPPTVIRRVSKSEFFAPLVSVSRRISFTGSPASKAAVAAATGEQRASDGEEGSSSDTPTNASTASSEGGAGGSPLKQLDSTEAGESVLAGVGKQQKRRRRVSRRPSKPLTPTKRRTLVLASELSDEEAREAELKERSGEVPEYNNETVYLCGPSGESSTIPPPPPPPPYNNETVSLDGLLDDTTRSAEELLSPLRDSEGVYYTASTSTPVKVHDPIKDTTARLEGHSPAAQTWLRELRWSGGEPEVMSTLQTKSIVQEAFKSLTITTNTVTKLIRQLQQRALYMQADFERIERLLASDGETPETVKLHQALSSADQLLANAAEFTRTLERRAVFFADSRLERRRYDEVLEQIRCITKDTRYSLERHHYISLESLLDDVQLLKRQLLIAVRQLFERMVGVVVRSVETAGGRSDLMLRANINMLVTLSNIDYEGFASLSDAFVQCEAVRALLIVCIEHRQSSVRALALRGLATICCAPEAIGQLGACGGIEIVRDTLQAPIAAGDGTLTRRNKTAASQMKRGAAERREAVSLLTQITAGWHGPAHRVAGLKACLEPIVEGLTHLIGHTECAQTLLLCAAALNNLGRLEVTSHYSIMSHEAIFRLIEVSEPKSEMEVSIFFYEQVVAMLHNMSLNKKCHSHLANSGVINFITATYQTQFYHTYASRAESEAQRRTIKAILHTLTRLVHDSNLGVDLLEQQRSMPSFLRLVTASIGAAGRGAVAGAPAATGAGAADQSLLESREISLLTRELLWAQREDEQPPEDYSVSEAAIDCGGMAAAAEERPRAATSQRAKTKADVGVVVGGTAAGIVAAAAETITTTTGQTYNLSRQESYV